MTEPKIDTRLHIANLQRSQQLVEFVTGVLSTLLITRAYGSLRAICYLAGMGAALTVQRVFLRAMMRRIGQEQASIADLITLSRATAASMLVGLNVSGIRDRNGVAGWLAWLVVLLGTSLCDWIDGPLARRAGPTRLGRVLDIESDSWLTLWSGMVAVRWGGLPRWSLLPPLIRYIYPLLALMQGQLPKGGGPWWSIASGTAQMLLFVGALAPVKGRRRDQILTATAWPISTIQLLSILASLRLSIIELMRQKVEQDMHKHESAL